MFKILSNSMKVVLPLQLAACGSDTPSFQEKPQSIIKVSVNTAEDPSTASGESFDIDTLVNGAASDDFGSADATAGGINSAANPGHTPDSGTRENFPGTGRTGSPGRSSADQTVPAPLEPVDAQPRPTPDAKAVAKACAPAMRNLGKPLTVVNVDDRNSNIVISPNSVIALKLTGDRVKVVLDLDSATPLTGVCFFLAGHEPELQFSTAAAVQAVAVIETGDQAKAQITLTGGSSESLSVDLRGHNPSLDISGVSSSLCEAALQKNPGSDLTCRP